MEYGPIAQPSVTVVVPMYNEEDCIEACLASLLKQTFPLTEIIVADDGSTDSSVAICESLKVRILKQCHKGPGAARNLGSRNAAGNILVFADADMVLAPDYVATLVAPIVQGKACATCHWDELVLNWDNPWARCHNLFLGLPERRRQPLHPPQGEQVYRAVRKDFFIAAGGFAENEGRGDDSSLYKRTGVLAEIVRKAGCYHAGPRSYAEVIREAVWCGRHVPVNQDHRLQRSLMSLLRRNPLYCVVVGCWKGLSHGEAYLPLYAIGYSLGYAYGIVIALATRNYLK